MASTKAPKKAAKAKKSRGAQQNVAAEQMPRMALREVIRVAEIIHEQFGGRGARWSDIAAAMNLGDATPKTKYLIWSAVAYGLIVKESKDKYDLAELGRQMIAPTYEGQANEARRKAALMPVIISKFFADYDQHPVPAESFFRNALSQKYGLPVERADAAMKVVVDNGEFAGLIVERDGKKYVNLGSRDVQEMEGVQVNAGERDDLKESGSTTPTLWKKTCFYITPIGADGSEERRHADMLLKHVIEPAVATFQMTVVRADKIERSGLITRQILEYIARSALCVCDLSFRNPNVFYELGVRHAWMLPSVQIIRKSDPIPFDVAQGRTILIDTSDVYSIADRMESAKRELTEHIRAALESHGKSDESNPLNVYIPGVKVQIPAP